MKIFIFFGFSSDSILDKVKDTIKNQNSQEKTHKSVNLVNRSIGKFGQSANRSFLSIFSALYLEGADFFVHLQTEMS